MAKKVIILGGTGKMGGWFAKFLKDKGFDVAILSRSPERAATAARELQIRYVASIDAVKDADWVIVSTPPSSTAHVVEEVSKKMKPNTVLFDIASVKGSIVEALEAARSLGIRTISIHPLFGPGTSSLKGKHVLVIPVSNDQKLIKEVENLFKEAEIHLVSSGRDHDLMIALTLALPHFLNIVFGKIVSNVDVRDLLKFAGTTFTLQLLLTEAVYTEDPDLYYEIQSQNPAFLKTLDLFIEIIKEAAFTVKNMDRETFITKFKEVQASLAKDPDFSQAYNRFYKAYEAIS